MLFVCVATVSVLLCRGVDVVVVDGVIDKSLLFRHPKCLMSFSECELMKCFAIHAVTCF